MFEKKLYKRTTLFSRNFFSKYAINFLRIFPIHFPQKLFPREIFSCVICSRLPITSFIFRQQCTDVFDSRYVVEKNGMLFPGGRDEF